MNYSGIAKFQQYQFLLTRFQGRLNVIGPHRPQKLPQGAQDVVEI